MSDYTPTGAPADQTRGASGTIRSEFQSVATAIATKADTAGETYTGAHDFSGSSGVTLPAATAIGSVSATELAYLDGVTSAIQTQLAGKSDTTGETYSGTHDFSGATSVVVPTPTTASQAVTKAYADQLAFATALPAQTGNSGKYLTTDGTSASWASLVPAGTAMLFAQTSAPTGWTKSTTHNDKALRVVSGTASSGGTVAFTTAFASKTPAGTVGNTTLSSSQVPNHSHNLNAWSGASNISYSTTTYITALCGGNSLWRDTTDSANTVSIASTSGGGSSHTHTFTGTAIDLAVQYVDVIIATKD